MQGCRLLVSYGASGEPAPAHAPPPQQLHGPTLPSPNHNDAGLDLKTIDLPIKMMLSSSRDGAADSTATSRLTTQSGARPLLSLRRRQLLTLCAGPVASAPAARCMPARRCRSSQRLDSTP